ncbi:hypothetical protein EI94DRAFT_1798564 [Lactarius quietus]|nr:hypothetical protein EI94DRAFT_1798564 [Lactarius quietus]
MAMLLSRLLWTLLPAVAIAAPALSDPCAAISGSHFSTPEDTLACLKSFPFNETLQQNVMATVSRVFDFYTFEYYYPSSGPFPSTIDIRAELARINSTLYPTDYDFNLDLYNTINQLNDGHTLWLPNCYVNWEALLPTPVVSISIPSGFTSYYESIGFNWTRLAGAQVLQIEGMDPFDYVDFVADTVTGNYLDHNVRVNSVYTGYRLLGSTFSQKFGDLAGRVFNPIEDLTFSLVPVGATEAENVTVPFLDVFTGYSFSDRDSYWANNCAANANTNGVNRSSKRDQQPPPKLPAKGIIRSPSDVIALPAQYQPSLAVVDTNASYMVSYMLPDDITGVIFVGSFEEPDNDQFQADLANTISSLTDAGATRLLMDLTNNPGGFICQGLFLHQYLTGLDYGYPGFQSAVRGNALAQKIVQQVIAENISPDVSFYVPEQWAFLNDTLLPNNFNYIAPPVPVVINGIGDTTSQRFHDVCPYSISIPSQAPFNLSQVAIVTNGNCASTCALFSTLMWERHNTTIAVFGGRPGQSIEFKGMAGNQVLEWTDLDTEIKTALLKNDPLAPPDFFCDMRHNWRTAYSYDDEDTPIAYLSEPPTLRFPYTNDTYNNPQKLWIFAAQEIFG